MSKTSNTSKTAYTTQDPKLVRLRHLADDAMGVLGDSSGDVCGEAAFRILSGANVKTGKRKHAKNMAVLAVCLLRGLTRDLIEGELVRSCLDGTESKQFRKGYERALAQVATELVERIETHA